MAKNLQHGSGAPTWDTRGRLSPAALPQRGAELVRAELVRALPETSGRTSSAAVGEKPAQRPGGQDPPHPWRQVLALPTFPTQLLSSPLAGRGGPRTQTKAWAVPSPPADSPAVPPTPPAPAPCRQGLTSVTCRPRIQPLGLTLRRSPWTSLSSRFHQMYLLPPQRRTSSEADQEPMSFKSVCWGFSLVLIPKAPRQARCVRERRGWRRGAAPDTAPGPRALHCLGRGDQHGSLL